MRPQSVTLPPTISIVGVKRSQIDYNTPLLHAEPNSSINLPKPFDWQAFQWLQKSQRTSNFDHLAVKVSTQNTTVPKIINYNLKSNEFSAQNCQQLCLEKTHPAPLKFAGKIHDPEGERRIEDENLWRPSFDFTSITTLIEQRLQYNIQPKSAQVCKSQSSYTHKISRQEDHCLTDTGTGSGSVLNSVSVAGIPRIYGQESFAPHILSFKPTQPQFLHPWRQPIQFEPTPTRSPQIFNEMPLFLEGSESNSAVDWPDDLTMFRNLLNRICNEPQRMNRGNRCIEKTIQETIQTVSLWTKLSEGQLVYDQHDNTLYPSYSSVKQSRDEVAFLIRRRRKTLEDYLMYIRYGVKFNFNFSSQKYFGFGHLRRYVNHHRKSFRNLNGISRTNSRIQNEFSDLDTLLDMIR